MNLVHVKYLLIGGGLASSSAAEAIRKIDPQGELMLVGQEPVRPYHRPPLSKAYLRARDRSELFVQSQDWYVKNDVRLRSGVRAASLDTARHVVALASGEEISYDKLLIATGMTPRHLTIAGSDLPSVYYVRTINDTDRLHNAVDKALAEGMRHDRGRGRATVIGGGVLGVELAATLTQLGLAVDLVVAKAHPWDKFAGEHTGRFITKFLENHRVAVHTGSRPLRLEGDGRVQRVVLDEDHFVQCDFVVAAVGANVNRDILRGTPITAEKAILVDEHCRTNIEHVYAAGDCAAVFDPLFGKHRLLDHWDNAVQTGKLAGANMAGADERYSAVNNFFSDVFDLSLNGWGESRLVDRRLIREITTNGNRPEFIEIGVAADGRVAQVLAVNHAGEDDVLKQLVARRVRIDGNEEAIKGRDFSLAELVK
jgi:NADPH-dependent 2,4-dienoyl-CoA reductase/sulfur reductase-like enzyme